MATTEPTTVAKPKKSSNRTKVKVRRTRGVGKHKFTEFVPHSKGKPLEPGEKRIILNIVSKLEQERPFELQKEIYKIASKYTGVSLSTVQNIKKEDKHKVAGGPTSGKSKSNNSTSKVKRTRRRKKRSDPDNFLMKDGEVEGGGVSGRQQQQQQNANNINNTCVGAVTNGSDVRNDSFSMSTLPLGLYHHGGTCTQGTYYLSSVQANIQSQ